MKKFRKIVISILMVVVWAVILAMVIPMKSSRGQLATVLIGLILNSILAGYYSYIDRRPASFREWLKM